VVDTRWLYWIEVRTTGVPPNEVVDRALVRFDLDGDSTSDLFKGEVVGRVVVLGTSIYWGAADDDAGTGVVLNAAPDGSAAAFRLFSAPIELYGVDDDNLYGLLDGVIGKMPRRGDGPWESIVRPDKMQRSSGMRVKPRWLYWVEDEGTIAGIRKEDDTSATHFVRSQVIDAFEVSGGYIYWTDSFFSGGESVSFRRR
jgi:hypothetical protein